MPETEISWLGLRTDREKEIYLEAFWIGVNAGKDIKNSIRNLETRWRIKQDTTVRNPEAKSSQGY